MKVANSRHSREVIKNITIFTWFSSRLLHRWCRRWRRWGGGHSVQTWGSPSILPGNGADCGWTNDIESVKKMKITLVTSTIPMEPPPSLWPLPAFSWFRFDNQLKWEEGDVNLVPGKKKNWVGQACKLLLLKLLLQATLVNCSLASEAALNFSFASPTCAISVLLIRSCYNGRLADMLWCFSTPNGWGGNNGLNKG